MNGPTEWRNGENLGSPDPFRPFPSGSSSSSLVALQENREPAQRVVGYESVDIGERIPLLCASSPSPI